MLPIRVFLVDPHEVTRRGLAAVLEAHPQIRVVGEGESVEQARRRALAVRPDVAVVADGALCEHLRAVVPGLRCLVLGYDGSPETVHAAVQAGAAGYLIKDVHSAQVLDAVQRVAAGEILFDAATVALAGRSPDGHHRDRLAPLTHRERQLLQLLGEGLSNREIGARLAVTEKTAKNQVSLLLAKLQLTNRTQAAILATLVRDGDGLT